MSSPKAVEVLYKPDAPVQFDVVFIHGIGADWKQTWSGVDQWPAHRGESQRPWARDDTLPWSQGDNELPNTLLSKSSYGKSQPWMQHRLGKDLHSARISVWGCHVVGVRQFNYSRIKVLGKAFLKAIEDFRQLETPDRPIIFLAHSIGGTVLKQALVQDEGEKRHLLPHTKGIIFLGTPDFRETQEWATFIKEVYIDSPKHIGKTQFEKLVKLNFKFEKLLFTSPLRVGYIYEELPTSGDQILVSKDKAIIGNQDQAEAWPARATHFSMTRINPSTDEHYHRILDIVRSMAATEDVDRSSTEILQRSKVIPSKSAFKDINEEDGRREILEELNHHFQEYRLLLHALRLDDGGHYLEAKKAYSSAATALAKNPRIPEHVALFARDKLTTIYIVLAKYAPAKKEIDSLISIKEKKYADDHQSMLRTARNYSLLLSVGGEFEKAFISLATRLHNATDIDPMSFDHILTKDVLCRILRSQENHAEAEVFLREVLNYSCSEYGPRATYTLSRASELSTLLWFRGLTHQAENVSWYAYEGLETQLGPHHPVVLRAARRYANYLRYSERLPEASRILHAVQPLIEIKLGKNHPAALWTSCSIAAIYILQGRISEGRLLLVNSHNIQKDVLPKNHRDSLWVSQAIRYLDKWKQDTSDRWSEFKEPKTARVVYICNGWPDIIDPDLLSPELRKILTEPSRDLNNQARAKSISLWQQVSRLHLKFGDNNTRTTTDTIPNSQDSKPISKDLITTNSGFWGSGIHYAAFHGDLPTVKGLLGDGWSNCGIFITPMRAATSNHSSKCRAFTPGENCCHIQIIEALLEHEALEQEMKALQPVGASPAIYPYLTNLEAAILFGADDLAALFARPKDYADHSSRIFGNTLCLAAPQGNTLVVESLLNTQTLLYSLEAFIFDAIIETAYALKDSRGVGGRSNSEPPAWFGETIKDKQEKILDVLDMLVKFVKGHPELDGKDKIVAKARKIIHPQTTPSLGGLDRVAEEQDVDVLVAEEWDENALFQANLENTPAPLQKAASLPSLGSLQQQALGNDRARTWPTSLKKARDKVLEVFFRRSSSEVAG